MSVADVYAPGKFGLSFELFPPKTPRGEENLVAHVAELVKFSPSYITCTYGAGGSTREKTLRIVADVKRRFELPVATHLTCVDSTVEDLRRYLRDATQSGVDYVVALRGDPPAGQSDFQAVEGGLSYANELVALLREEFPHFGVAVAGYPETHQEAPDAATDLVNLKRKVDAGADVVITQLFYDNADFFRFRERCEQAGIAVPIIPGILPVTNFAQIQRITSLCQAKLPEAFVAELERCTSDEQQFDVGVRQATEQVAGLIEQGVPGVHFYVLNKSQATAAVLRNVKRPG